MRFFTNKHTEPIEVSGWQDIQKLCAEKYSIQSFQVSAGHVTEDGYTPVILTNKLGETFAIVGYID